MPPDPPTLSCAITYGYSIAIPSSCIQTFGHLFHAPHTPSQVHTLHTHPNRFSRSTHTLTGPRTRHTPSQVHTLHTHPHRLMQKHYPHCWLSVHLVLVGGAIKLASQPIRLQDHQLLNLLATLRVVRNQAQRVRTMSGLGQKKLA